MAVTLEMLVELVSDVEAARAETEAALHDAQARVASLNDRLSELRQEEASFRAAMARRFPEAASRVHEPAAALAEPAAVFVSWTAMPRTDAVEKAIRDLHAATGQTVAPGDIEGYLRQHGRSDNRDDIGGSTARLNKVGRIHSIGRGRWLPGPSETPGDDVGASSPGPVPATRPGGDEDETAPSSASTVPPDHDPTFGERDDRDHHRLADDRVAVEF